MSRVIPQGGSHLPPPGDERREVLRERADDLAQAAEEAGAAGGRIDPRAFEVDNEIANHIDDLSVSGQRDEYVYCWVNFTHNHGRMIRLKLSEGWEVVQGDDPEAIEFKAVGADTTRRHGDVLLMKCRRDRYKLLQKREAAKRAAQQGAVTAQLEEMGQKAAPHGITVHSSMDTINPRVASRMMARQAGTRAVDQMLRTGTVPGMEV